MRRREGARNRHRGRGAKKGDGKRSVAFFLKASKEVDVEKQKGRKLRDSFLLLECAFFQISSRKRINTWMILTTNTMMKASLDCTSMQRWHDWRRGAILNQTVIRRNALTGNFSDRAHAIKMQWRSIEHKSRREWQSFISCDKTLEYHILYISIYIYIYTLAYNLKNQSA